MSCKSFRDLENHKNIQKFTKPSGLILIPEFITKEDEKSFMEEIDKRKWSDVLKRRTQHYGYRYDYKKRNIDKIEKAENIPEWSSELIKNLINQGLFSRKPDQMIVNEYKPGQGISRHIDSLIFDEPIVSISLLSSCVMIFTLNKEKIEILLKPRDALVMTGDSRWKWYHEIPARKKDKIGDQIIERTRRISMTFRLLKD